MITDRHRVFYINDKLEYALFYNKEIVDKEKIKDNFLAGKDWKDFSRYNDVKSIISFIVSEDLKTVHIKVKTAKPQKEV